MDTNLLNAIESNNWGLTLGIYIDLRLQIIISVCETKRKKLFLRELVRNLIISKLKNHVLSCPCHHHVFSSID